MAKLARPSFYMGLWRIGGLFFLTVLWFIENGTRGTFVLVMLLAIMAALRWRIQLPGWTVLIDLCFCLLFSPFWVGSLYGLALPLVESLWRGRPYYCVPIPFIVFASGAATVHFVVFLLSAALFGTVLRHWQQQRTSFWREIDQERKARYELERLKIDLLQANSETAQMAELTERNRIARDLHDHLGHDLTGALLALQAYEQCQHGEQAEKMFAQVKKRLTRSTKRLRDTVHDMTPVALIGEQTIESITENFTYCPVSYQKSGNMDSVPVYLWSLLIPCLKEALTNVARHSDATKVTVHLDVTETIVRLSIQDNGTCSAQSTDGSGLRNLKIRARAAGGSLSVNRSSGYSIVCVLPIQERKEAR